MESYQKLGTFLLNKPMSLIKVVLLCQYSNEKMTFRKIKSILDLENWHGKLKKPLFEDSQSNSLTRYQKIL